MDNTAPKIVAELASARQNRPEVKYLRGLVGKTVSVMMNDGGCVRGKLAFVDVYSIGVAIFHQSDEVALLFKHSIKAIRPEGGPRAASVVTDEWSSY